MGQDEREILDIVRRAQGFYYFGIVSSVVSPTQFTVADLAAMGDGFFLDFLVTVVQKFDGTTTPPREEFRPITAYVSAGALFTHTAFTAGLAVGDKVLIVMGTVTGATGYGNPAEIPVNTTSIAANETNILSLAGAGDHYIVDKLRLKAADPGVNTILVRLYELVNGVATVVDTFTIVGGGAGVGNWETYFSLMDMFGIPNMVGDNLRVSVQSSGGAGPYAITGEYSFRISI